MGKILVLTIGEVEDNAMIENYLLSSNFHYKCVKCLNEQEALQEIKSDIFDCIIFNYNKNFSEFTLYIIGTLSNNYPIIIVSPKTNTSFATSATKIYGAYSYLIKENLTIDVLEDSIISSIESKRNNFYLNSIKDIQKQCKQRIEEYDKQVFFNQLA